ncbi:uncharacterized protein LOC135158759 [Lytechinus pictus]|uniref:uncharacterized protein LOC135158759 n=1 Tax=Lytechinus pictus TaxID=7653 RepID=UPI0030B9FB00
MEKLKDFLRQRGLKEDIIQKMVEDKQVDVEIIPLLDDKKLAEYIPAYGDRVAVVTFCKCESGPSCSTSSPKAAKPSMVDNRLKIKIKKSQKKNIGNRNAEKEERRVEIGWKDFDVASMEYKQIRTSKGGRTRHLKLGKNATAVGRILVKGFIDHKIFPLRMAPAFVIGMLFGEDAVLPDTLMESFKLYLNDGDRACVQSALSENTTEEEHEALVDLLDREGGHTIPKEGKSLALMFQLAHKVIIQNGSYAMQCMREVVTPQLLSNLPTPSVVLSIYQELQPTTKKEETNSVRLLMQYIKGQDKKGLKKLMHFLTGSEVMSVSKIMVQFTSLEGAGRRPVAHTCGPTLELPSTYGSYREFRQEWDCILASGYMNFDFG